jgi:hypothetical protein
MSLAQSAVLSQTASFRDRCAMAMATAAAAVVGENTSGFTGGATGAKAVKRHNLAVSIAVNPRSTILIDAFTAAILCDATVAVQLENSLDAQIQNACNAAFGNIAGVAFGE